MKFPPILLVLGLFSDVRAIPMPFPLPVNFSYGICGFDPTGIPAMSFTVCAKFSPPYLPRMMNEFIFMLFPMQADTGFISSCAPPESVFLHSGININFAPVFRLGFGDCQHSRPPR